MFAETRWNDRCIHRKVSWWVLKIIEITIIVVFYFSWTYCVIIIIGIIVIIIIVIIIIVIIIIVIIIIVIIIVIIILTSIQFLSSFRCVLDNLDRLRQASVKLLDQVGTSRRSGCEIYIYKDCEAAGEGKSTSERDHNHGKGACRRIVCCPAKGCYRKDPLVGWWGWRWRWRCWRKRAEEGEKCKKKWETDTFRTDET